MYKYLTLFALVLFVSSCSSKKRAITTKKPHVEHKKESKNTETTNPKTEPFVVPKIVSVEHYIDVFHEIAQEEMRKYGIPASITLAQGILESGAGRGELTLKSNNHFGIKCHTGWNGARAYHDDDERGECFRKYTHPLYSFRDHSEFLATRSRYAFLFELRKDNYKGWARGLKKAGYATDPKYPNKLISLIEKYKLYKYDREVIKEGKLAVKSAPKETNWVNHVVREGDTLYALAKLYNTTVDDIKSLNGLKTNTIKVGQLLIIKTPITSK